MAELFSQRCVGCHQQGGPAQNTRLVFEREGGADWNAANLGRFSGSLRPRSGVPYSYLSREAGRYRAWRRSYSESWHPGFDVLEGLVYRMTGALDNCGQPVGDEPVGVPDPGDQECGELSPGRRMLRRLSHTEYQNTIRDLLGIEIDAPGAFVADTVVDGFANNPDALFVGGLLAEQYRQMAETLAKEVYVEALMPCEIAEADMNCAHSFIAQFGSKAFRRPLTAEEITGYRTLLRAVVAEGVRTGRPLGDRRHASVAIFSLSE